MPETGVCVVSACARALADLLRALDALFDLHLEGVLLDVKELDRPPALKQRLRTEKTGPLSQHVSYVCPEPVLAKRSRFETEMPPTGEAFFRASMASSSSRIFPELNFLSVFIFSPSCATVVRILSVVAGFSALTAVAYLHGAHQAAEKENLKTKGEKERKRQKERQKGDKSTTKYIKERKKGRHKDAKERNTHKTREGTESLWPSALTGQRSAPTVGAWQPPPIPLPLGRAGRRCCS